MSILSDIVTNIPYIVTDMCIFKLLHSEKSVQGDQGLLNVFNNWQSENSGKIPHHDTAQLFSGNGFESNILGLAGVGTICDASMDGSVTQLKQSTNVANGVIAAHE